MPPSTPPSPPPSASTITIPQLRALLTRYDAPITHLSSAPGTKKADLQTLDHLRYIDIPARVAARKKDAETSRAGEGEGVYLTKSEVQDLVQWKLTHGRFRPRLTQLVASNSAPDVRATTRAAFETYASSPSSPDTTYMSAITTLTKLRGIGPATASLLLAVYEPDRVPFFGDDLFRWVCCSDDGEGEGEGEVGVRWGERIGYTAGEYALLWEGVRGVRGRLGGEVGAVDLERGAWVLGWEAKGGENGSGVGEDGGGKGGKRGRVEGRRHDLSSEPAGKKRQGSKKARTGDEGGLDGDGGKETVHEGEGEDSTSPPAPNGVTTISDKPLITTTTTTSEPEPEPEPEPNRAPNRPISPPPLHHRATPKPAKNANGKRTDTQTHLSPEPRRSKRLNSH